MKHTHRRFPVDADYGGYTGAFGDPRNDDSLTACPVCDTDGWRFVLEDGKRVRELCQVCEGWGWLDESGAPYNPDALAKLAEGE